MPSAPAREPSTLTPLSKLSMTFAARTSFADPSVKDETGGFSQFGKWPKGVARGGWQNGITIQVTFPGGCKDPDTPKDNSFKTGGPDCHRILADKIVNNGDTGPGQQKRGGSLVSSVCKPFDVVESDSSY